MDMLARCEECGFISQEENVHKHIAEAHQFSVMNEYDLEDPVIEEPAEGDSQSGSCSGSGFQSRMNQADDSNKLYWSTPQIKLLLQLYDINRKKFEDKKTRNKKIWKIIANNILEKGSLQVTPEQCENKLKNLKKTYKKIIDNNKNTGRGALNWPFFKEMDQIFSGDPDVQCIASCSNLEGSSNGTQENGSNEQENIRGSKKRTTTEQEPEWFKKFREDCDRRHEEKMKRQDTLLELLEKLIDKC